MLNLVTLNDDNIWLIAPFYEVGLQTLHHFPVLPFVSFLNWFSFIFLAFKYQKIGSYILFDYITKYNVFFFWHFSTYFYFHNFSSTLLISTFCWFGARCEGFLVHVSPMRLRAGIRGKCLLSSQMESIQEELSKVSDKTFLNQRVNIGPRERLGLKLCHQNWTVSSEIKK